MTPPSCCTTSMASSLIHHPAGQQHRKQHCLQHAAPGPACPHSPLLLTPCQPQTQHNRPAGLQPPSPHAILMCPAPSHTLPLPLHHPHHHPSSDRRHASKHHPQRAPSCPPPPPSTSQRTRGRPRACAACSMLPATPRAMVIP